VTGDRLRALWDFDDLDATEARFQHLLEEQSDAAGRAEVLTQLARVRGLQGRFEEGDRLVDEAEALAGSSAPALARVRLERGRLRRSGGDEEAARSLFESAFDVAFAAGEEFLALDAAHMVAITAPEREARLAWAQRGIELAGDSYWLGPLLNNLGWEHYSAGDYEAALAVFERALQAREREPEKRAEIELARQAVAETLRALGRPEP
jgi:tetratricopeptide (TPR) repeat protein